MKKVTIPKPLCLLKKEFHKQMKKLIEKEFPRSHKLYVNQQF